MSRSTTVRRYAVATLVGLSVILAGCTTTPPSNPWAKAVADGNIIGASHAAAEGLFSQASSALDPNKTLLVASFVNIDDLEQTSSFGRIVSQQFATKFTQLGFQLIEMLLRKDIYIKQKGGEFLLSREVQELSQVHGAQAVIVGTYAVGAKSVFVTAKIINAKDRAVMAAFDYQLPVGSDTRQLLKTKS